LQGETQGGMARDEDLSDISTENESEEGSAKKAPTEYNFKWNEPETCARYPYSHFPTKQWETGARESRKLYPWANAYIKRSKVEESFTPLRELAWKTVGKQGVDLAIFVLMAILTLFTIGYLIFRGIKRAKRKLEKREAKKTQTVEMTEEEKEIEKRRRDNRKRSCLIEFLRLRRVQSITCCLVFCFSVWTIFMMVKIWQHVNRATGSFKQVDCAFARAIEFMDKGLKPLGGNITITTMAELELDQETLPFFGFTNYHFFVSELSNNFDKIKSNNLPGGDLEFKNYLMTSAV
jgi:hypothetical protein